MSPQDKQHSRFGGSSIDRISKCPGSANLCIDIPRVDSKYSLEGTQAHLAAEQFITSGMCISEYLNGVDTKAVNIYVDYFKSNLGIIAGNHKAYIFGVEQKISLDYIHPEMYGTCDAYIYDDHKSLLEVIDFKYGAGVPIEATDNKQLMYYALGLVYTLKIEPALIKLTIVQPRCEHPEGPIRSVIVTYAELMIFEDWLKGVIALADEAISNLEPGKHCQFCPAKQLKEDGSYYCPALNEQRMLTTSAAFADSPLTVTKTYTLSDYLDAIPTLEDWIKQIREKALDDLTEGKEVKGWKLVEKRAIRKWNPKLLESLEPTFPHEVLYATELRSPAQVEKLLVGKDKKIVDHFCVKESSGVTLAPENDNRNAAVIENGVNIKDM